VQHVHVFKNPDIFMVFFWDFLILFGSVGSSVGSGIIRARLIVFFRGPLKETFRKGFSFLTWNKMVF